MKKNIHQWLSLLVLAEWGWVMIYLKASGRLVSFLHPGFHNLVLVTGMLLLLCALVLFVVPEEDCKQDPGHDCCDHDHPHDLTPRGLLVFLVLLLPFGLSAWLSPNGYGEVKVRNSLLVENGASLPSRNIRIPQPEPATGLPPLPVKGVPIDTEGVPQPPAGDMLSQPSPSTPSIPMTEGQALEPDKNGNIPTSVIELVCAAYDPPGLKAYKGRKVVLSGQFMTLPPGEKSAASRFNLLRMLMVCCAADARPVSVIVDTGKLAEFKKPAEMAWLEVVGRVNFEKRGEINLVVITADSVRPAPAPDDAFLY